MNSNKCFIRKTIMFLCFYLALNLSGQKNSAAYSCCEKSKAYNDCDTSNFAYFLIDINSYKLSDDVYYPANDIYILNKNYSEKSINSLISKINNVFLNEPSRKRKYKKTKDYKEFKPIKKLDAILDGLGVPRISFTNSCSSSIERFKKLTDGIQMKNYYANNSLNKYPDSLSMKYTLIKHYFEN